MTGGLIFIFLCVFCTEMLLDDHRGDIFLFHKDYVAAGTGPTISFSGQKTIYGAAGQSMGISVQHDDNKAKTG